MKTKNLRCILLLALLVKASSLFAQPGILSQTKNEKGKIIFVKFNPLEKPLPLNKANEVLRSILGLKETDSYQMIEAEKDQLGFIHQFYQQYYKGIKVEFAAYAVHARNGLIESINGEFYPVGEVDVNPSLSEESALAKALAFVGASRYMWQIPAEEQWLKETTESKTATYYPKGATVICKNYFKENGSHRLSYKFEVYAQEPLSRDYIYVDALNGDILYREAIIKHTNVTGGADTRYSSRQNITTFANTDGTFSLRETLRGAGIETRNAGGYMSYSSSAEYRDNDNNWTAAEYNNANEDNMALDAHWGSQRTLDYFQNVHGRNGWDSKGAKVTNYVRWGVGWNNAS
jgi:Zn-dependent metalloprotease